MKEKGPKRRKVQRLTSAGGVVLRNRQESLEIALCGRRDPERWSLPKGAPEADETLEKAALREVQEETGLVVALEASLGSISYWFVRPEDGYRCQKTVHFYLMSLQGGDVARHDPEFDEVRWFPVEEALKVMTYPNEAEMVEKALALKGTEQRGSR